MSEGLRVEARSLSKSYQKGGNTISVLRALDLSVASGESLTILGASGVGKSTLLHLLGTLDAPSAGEVVLDEKSVAGMATAKIAELRNQALGFVFQFHHLLKDFNAEENVAMPLWLRGINKSAALTQARELLARVGLAARFTHKSGELSGGEQQRVAIARALVGRPRLLLADEPTGNLDRATAEQVQDLLLELNRENGCTLILVTHNEVFAHKLNRMVWLHDGTIHQHKPHP